MPNIQLDFFYDNDIFNFTATRSGGVPKVKPAWKVRTAPKLPPKEKPEAESSAKPNRPPSKPVNKPVVQPKKPAPTPKGSGAQKNGVNGVKSAEQKTSA